MTEFRTERDSMGELKVPEQALWGAQTQRAVDNFPISGLPMPRGFIRALGLIKWAAAGVNAAGRRPPGHGFVASWSVAVTFAFHAGSSVFSA